jgi:hypothetical protein
MWRRGLLSDKVYTGDLAFGALLKQYTPWVHDGYLTYGRWVENDTAHAALLHDTVQMVRDARSRSGW